MVGGESGGDLEEEYEDDYDEEEDGEFGTYCCCIFSLLIHPVLSFYLP